MRSHLLSSLLFVATLLASPVARSATDPREVAASHDVLGAQALSMRQYQRALAEYVVAFAYEPSTERLVNVAQAWEGLGEKGAAIDLYKRVSDTGQGPAADLARQRLLALGAAPAPTGTPVMLTVVPPGAEIWVDGQLKGRSPMPAVVLTPGPHAVEVRFAGYRTYTETIQVAGQPLSRVVTLMPGAGPVGPVGPPPSALTIRIDSVPAGATVTLNGQAVAVQGGSAIANVVPGPYTVVVKHPSFADFTRTVSVQPGQSAVVQVAMVATLGGAGPVGPAPTATGDLGGAWYAVPLAGTIERDERHRASLTLSGQGGSLTGELIMSSSLNLPGWKQKACKDSPTADWDTRYQVNLVQMVGGRKLFATNGQVVGCSCPGNCNALGSLEIPVIVSPDNLVMVSEDLVFQRKPGGEIPKEGTRADIGGQSLSGKFHVRMGTPDKDEQGEMTLTAGGAGASGSLAIDQTSTLPNWKRAQCNGDSVLKMTNVYSITAVVSGGEVKLTFGGSKATNCSCESACGSVTSSMGGKSARLTLDGNHLVGPGLVLTRK